MCACDTKSLCPRCSADKVRDDAPDERLREDLERYESMREPAGVSDDAQA